MPRSGRCWNATGRCGRLDWTGARLQPARKRGTPRQPRNRAEFFSRPLETKSGFSNFFVATAGWLPGASGARDPRRAPVVSGAARNHFALWRIWLCALTISHRSGARPSASTAFSTSRNPPSGPARITTRPTTSNGSARTATRSRLRWPASRPTTSRSPPSRTS